MEASTSWVQKRVERYKHGEVTINKREVGLCSNAESRGPKLMHFGFGKSVPRDFCNQ